MSFLVSIIVPCYNAENTIAQTIESVLRQTYLKWEMIIIDDCSTDSSAFIIKGYEKKDSRIIYLRTNSPSGSPSLPRNVGIEAAKGRYIAFLDSDDMWLPHKLEEQVNFLNDAEIAIVFSDYEKINMEGHRTFRIVKAPLLVNYSLLLKGNCIGCLTAMYDSEKVGKIGFENVGHEDFVLWLSILKKGFKARNTGTVTALYRVGKHSVSSNKLKVLSWQWNILRRVEKLPLYKSCYFYIHYAVRALLKSLK